ncbi:right-handed parallel beta-helix repeat-containing protein [Saccharibacillus sacchari]|uniref:Right-handed parallel beta-helix repeat-containing protein n=1 Tax=Saccharibacillus sacchari TaxID=456493 RepID=A0ACC6PG74_9BACL
MSAYTSLIQANEATGAETIVEIPLLSASISTPAESSASPASPASNAGTSSPAAARADAKPYYYVAPGGSDTTGTGSKSSPWKTVQRAADAAMKTGGTVYLRGGVYSQQLKLAGTPGAAGSAARLTVASYPSETAVLDGKGLSVQDTGSLVELHNASRVTVRGLELRNYKTAASGSVPIGIYVHGSGAGVRLLDNKVHDIGNTSSPKGSDLAGRDAHGIAVYGTEAPASISDLTISGNEVCNLTLGSSEALVLNGNVEKFTVANNHVHDNDNIGIDVIGFEGTSPNAKYDQARDGAIAGNLVTGSTSVRNPSYGRKVPNGSYSAGGIYIDGGRDLIVERNRSESNDIGIEIASEHGGRSTSGIVVRSNLVVRNALTGIAMGGYDEERGSTTGSTITGNTVAYNDTLEWGTGQLYIQFDTRDNVIRNNIFAASGSNVLIDNEYTENTRNTIDHNLYFAPDKNAAVWIWKGKTYTGFAAYRKGSGNDADSLFADPQFVDANSDYRLKSGSPASASGTPDKILSAAPDLDGKPRGKSATGKPSRGAYE